jgi:hypothetical protein
MMKSPYWCHNVLIISLRRLYLFWQDENGAQVLCQDAELSVVHIQCILDHVFQSVHFQLSFSFLKQNKPYRVLSFQLFVTT